jgi:general secretion pathway protein G
MNKPSRLFWCLVLAQGCVVLFAIGPRIVRHFELRPDIRVKATISDIKGMFPIALNMFSNDCGRLPATAEGLQALITCPTDVSQKLWKGPYIDPPQIPLDVWGHAYVYRCPGIHNTNSYDLYSAGPDEVSKSGDPDGINNWDPKFPLEDPSADDSLFVLLLLIPFACGVWSIATIFSPGAREFFSRNRAAHFIWVIISLLSFTMFLASQLVLRVVG